MKVLVSFDNILLPHTTGGYFLDAFCKIAEVTFALPQRLDEVKNDFDLCIKIDDGLSNHEWRKDLHPSMYYIIDSHLEEESDWRKEAIVKGNFDYIVTAQRNGGHALGVKSTWIPTACDPVKHYVGIYTKLYDVCFIGNFHSKFGLARVDYCDRLFREFPNFFWGFRVFREMAEKYAESRIVFNHSLNSDINMRAFEACCSGSFQITSRIKDNGFEEIFEEGKHLVTYGSEEEMVDKIKYYLKNKDLRERIARAGCKHVIENHTYLHRSRAMLELVK